MAKKALSGLGTYLEERKNAAERIKKRRKAENALKANRTPSQVTRVNVPGYITENGIDREDAAIRKNDRNELINNINDMITGNQLKRRMKK